MDYLDYARQGLKVFACFENKQPATPSGVYDATTDEEILQLQFYRENLFIGLACGSVNNIVVIDFDLYKMNISFDELKDSLKYDFPDTLTIQTMSGGIHLIYKIDNQKGKVKTATKIFGQNIHIDSRGDGGYIIAAGSPGYTPVDVEFEELKENFFELLSDAPEWVYDFKKPELSQNHKVKFDPLSDNEYNEIRAALSVIPSDDRDLWINFGIALKNTYSPRAFQLWDEWSEKSPKYKSEDQAKRWETFKPTGDITIASIFQLAKGYGFTSTYSIKIEQEGQINIEDIDEKKNHDKKPFPKELLNPPGLVGEMIELINKLSKKRQPILALAASLTAAGAIMGQKFQTDQGLRTNLYILGVGESGCGKEAARSAIKRLFDKAGMSDWAGTEDLASDASILSSLEMAPSQVFLLDEIGRFLKTTNQSSKAIHLYNVISVLLKIYSSANQTFRGKSYADLKNQKIINQPNLCLYGTTTPRTLFDGLTVENITEGFLSRFMIFESEDPNPAPEGRRKIADCSIPDSLVKTLKSIKNLPYDPDAEGNLEKVQSIKPRIVKMTPEAEEIINQYEHYIYTRRQELRAEDRIDSTYNRAVQFAEQIALIIAVGIDHKAPIITDKEIIYAIKLVNYLSDRMHHICEHYISRNEYESEGKRVLNIIRDAGKRGITLTQLTRKTQHLKEYERKDILSSLYDSDLILIGTEGRKKIYYPKKIEYRKNFT